MDSPKSPAARNASFSYIVISRDEETPIESRAEAVALAKSLTATADISVTVEREDGRERMQFRQGSLVDFVYEIRTGRPNRDGDDRPSNNRGDGEGRSRNDSNNNDDDDGDDDASARN